MRTKRTTTTPHPLESLALATLKGRGAHDALTLAMDLSGCDHLTRPIPRGYKVVAQHVLDVLESQGKVFQDVEGWYYLTATKGDV